jgi:hypothetical protein
VFFEKICAYYFSSSVHQLACVTTNLHVTQPQEETFYFKNFVYDENFTLWRSVNNKSFRSSSPFQNRQEDFCRHNIPATCVFLHTTLGAMPLQETAAQHIKIRGTGSFKLLF